MLPCLSRSITTDELKMLFRTPDTIFCVCAVLPIPSRQRCITAVTLVLLMNAPCFWNGSIADSFAGHVEILLVLLTLERPQRNDLPGQPNFGQDVHPSTVDNLASVPDHVMQGWRYCRTCEFVWFFRRAQKPQILLPPILTRETAKPKAWRMSLSSCLRSTASRLSTWCMCIHTPQVAF
jgi:hypothetical protein